MSPAANPVESPAAQPIRILVADDHPVVRDGLVAILATQPDFAIAGEAASGREVVDKAIALRPDVVLLDLEMPDMDGVEALQALRTAWPEPTPVPAMIAFTAFDTDERILGAVENGARGYLLKGAPREEIFRAIRVVSQGGSLIEPVVASKLLRHLSTAGERAAIENASALYERLTGRECQVLALLAQGMTNREIATELVITERTAKFHVSSILRKLGAGNRTEAVTIAAQHGLVRL
jgi:DNA-binding NarL/FixJ family response regulator